MNTKVFILEHPAKLADADLEKLYQLAQRIHRQSPRLGRLLADYAESEIERRMIAADPECGAFTPLEPEALSINCARWRDGELGAALAAACKMHQFCQGEPGLLGLAHRIKDTLTLWAAHRLTRR